MNNSTLQMTRRLLCHHLLLTGLLLASAICPTTAAENKGGGNADAASAQSTRQSAVIEGVIKDADGAPIVGATVAVKGSAIGALTDAGGHYILNNVPAGSILSVSYVGMKPQEITVGNAARQTINVKMEMDAIDEVVVVAFGTQKKESIVSSIETINPKELKVPSSNLTTALAGRMSGVIAYQRSGEPGADGADFFIRGVTSFGYKVDPLILIDGIESTKTDLSRLQPDDIAAFSILKDATATALYGARGANGVIQVSTKTGEVGAAHISLRFENSFSMNNKDIELADPVTFMKLANEAALTRNPQAALIYPKDKIEQTRRGADRILYPNNDWIDQLIKPYTMNQRFNANISGGGRVARFYLAGTFNIDNGVLRNDAGNDFKNNISLKNYSIRSNTDLQLTKTTVATVRVYAQFDDYHGPVGGGEKIFNSAMSANPVAFPAVYPRSYSPNTTHPMFGSALVPNSTSQLYANPYAQMVSGYQTNNTSTVNAQLEFKQDFGFWLPGLTARAMGYTQRYSYFSTSRQYNPFFYKANATSQGIVLTPYNDGGNNSIGTAGGFFWGTLW